MREISECPVCGLGRFTMLFPNSYDGTPGQAAAFFLTDREKAVHGRIVRCDGCGFVLTSPQYEYEEYEQIYREVARIETPPGRGHAVAARYRRLASHVRKRVSTGRFFDFGCGDGQFLDIMTGFDCVGLELRSTAQEIQKSADGRIIVGELHAAMAAKLLTPASFDFVTMWDVIEHLPRLAGDIAALRSLLKPGGWLFLSAPNVASIAARVSGERWNCYLLEHLWYFSPETLKAFMERQGFARGEVCPFLFPADMATLASRIEQTYGVRLPVPRAMQSWTLPLPAGVMFGAFRRVP